MSGKSQDLEKLQSSAQSPPLPSPPKKKNRFYEYLQNITEKQKWKNVRLLIIYHLIAFACNTESFIIAIVLLQSFCAGWQKVFQLTHCFPGSFLLCYPCFTHYFTMTQWLEHWIPNLGFLGSKPLSDSKVDSAFHSFEASHMITRIPKTYW